MKSYSSGSHGNGCPAESGWVQGEWPSRAVKSGVRLSREGPVPSQQLPACPLGGAVEADPDQVGTTPLSFLGLSQFRHAWQRTAWHTCIHTCVLVCAERLLSGGAQLSCRLLCTWCLLSTYFCMLLSCYFLLSPSPSISSSESYFISKFPGSFRIEV